MESIQIGLVLKRFFPYKQKVCILNKKKGKINLILIQPNLIQKLWPGMIIEYEQQWNEKKINITNKISILSTLTSIEEENIKWFHSLLEISYYSLPLHSPCPDTFELLCHSILLLNKQKTFKKQFNSLKKIYFLKLLHILGLVPETEIFSIKTQGTLLSSIFIDFSNKQKVESVKVKLKNISNQTNDKINYCIMQSIKKHPFYNNFKTDYFIVKS